MSEKIYIGSGKERHFENGGSVINCTLTLDGIADIYNKYGFATHTGAKKLKIIVAKRREPDNYGNTHFITVDTWKPDNNDDVPF